MRLLWEVGRLCLASQLLLSLWSRCLGGELVLWAMRAVASWAWGVAYDLAAARLRAVSLETLAAPAAAAAQALLQTTGAALPEGTSQAFEALAAPTEHDGLQVAAQWVSAIAALLAGWRMRRP